MGLKLSALTLTQRALNSINAPSQRAERARAVAQVYISDRGNRRGMEEAICFLRDEADITCCLENSYIIVPDHCEPPPLPPRYGLKGGAARERLRASLLRGEIREPRDVDLIRRGHFHIPEDDAAARQFMSIDYLHGARVELIRNLERYLSSRDLTINELASFHPTLSVSILGLLDSIGSVIRPSYYRGGTLQKPPTLEGKIMLKMARLFAEGECRGESWLMVGIPDQVSFSEFDLAIHLNKAFQRGRDVAEKFLHTCSILSLLPASNDLLGTTLEDLEHLRHGERGLLPDVPSDLWREF